MFIVGDIVLFNFPIISFFWFEVHLVIQEIEYLLYQAMKIKNWLIFKMCWILKQKEEQVLREVLPSPDAFELRNTKTCMIGYVYITQQGHKK